MLKVFVVLVCLVVAFGYGNTTNTSLSIVVTKTSQPSVPTVAASSSVAPHTSVAPPASPSPMISSTQNPMTPSLQPTPSTSVPTTSTSVPTTTPMPTTTPTPKPTTLPPYGRYGVKDDKSGKYCLLAEFEATFTIHYLKRVQVHDNKTNSTVTEKEEGTVVLNRTTPAQVSNQSDCGLLVLQWPPKKPFYTLKIEFARVKGLGASNESSWQLSSVSFLAKLKGNTAFPNATEEMVNSTYTASGTAAASYKVGYFYSCKSETDLKLETGDGNYSVDADFTDWKVEPFVSRNNTKDFGPTGTECYRDHPTNKPTTEKDDNNDIVPIAVGCALAGLVLIVLIAYVIGRRKSHRGYEKV